MKILLLFIASGISAYLYRLGGKQGYNTKFRDLGCPLITLIALWLLAGFQLSYWWAYLTTYGLMFAALTTYWDWLSYENKDNFYLHGFFVGLAMLPLLWTGITWYAILGRAIFLALSFGSINKYVNKWLIPHSDQVEEHLRGSILIATLPILLI